MQQLHSLVFSFSFFIQIDFYNFFTTVKIFILNFPRQQARRSTSRTSVSSFNLRARRASPSTSERQKMGRGCLTNFTGSVPDGAYIFPEIQNFFNKIRFFFHSATCRDTYRLPDSNYVKRDDEKRALCTSEFSDISPLTGGNVAFSTLEGRPSAYNFDESKELQVQCLLRQSPNFIIISKSFFFYS